MPLTLETSRLLLRSYRHDDWERVHIYAAVPEFSQFEQWGPNTVQDTQKFIADMLAHSRLSGFDRFKFEFAICQRDTGLLIGGCGLRRESQTSSIASLGWAINPEFQNKGFASEAALRLIEFGFNDLGLSVIYATCDARNLPSFRVMEKVGMRRVGDLKGERMQKGILRDTYRYEVKRLLGS